LFFVFFFFLFVFFFFFAKKKEEELSLSFLFLCHPFVLYMLVCIDFPNFFDFLPHFFFCKGAKSDQEGANQPGEAGVEVQRSFAPSFEWEKASCSNGTYSCFAHRKAGSQDLHTVINVGDCGATMYLKVIRGAQDLVTGHLDHEGNILIGVGVPKKGKGWAVVKGKETGKLSIVLASTWASVGGAGVGSWTSEEVFWKDVDDAALLVAGKFPKQVESDATTPADKWTRSAGDAPPTLDDLNRKEEELKAALAREKRLKGEKKSLQKEVKSLRGELKDKDGTVSGDIDTMQMQKLKTENVKLQGQVQVLQGQVEVLTSVLRNSQPKNGSPSRYSRRSRSRSRTRGRRSRSKERKKHRSRSRSRSRGHKRSRSRSRSSSE
jgi:hypothetical protein